jgi:5-enolpyruvylshikimate-3-phosphate synthase
LVDIKLQRSKLQAAKDKLHALPFPGINMDNLPFLGLIATVAKGRTLVHDWSYENRAIYFTELSKLNAQIELVDPHRVYITGPTKWKPADVVAPPALRPSVVILLAMLAAPGVSILRDVYSINRGYEELAARLNSLGADVQPIACLEVTGRNYEAEVSSLYVNMHKAAAILKNDQLLEKHIRHQLSNYLPIISGARMMKDYLKFIFPKPQIQPKKEPQIKRIPIQ